MALWLATLLAIGADAADAPPARGFHTVVNVDGQMLVFGGIGAAPSAAAAGLRGEKTVRGAPLFNDLWAYNQTGNTWVELKIADPPAARQLHAASVVVGGDKMYVFYGWGATGFLSDVCYYSVLESKWETAPVNGENKPVPRVSHTAVATDEGRILISGGFGQGTDHPLDDLWEYDPVTGTWSQRASLPPEAGRAGHSAVMVKDTMYVFGGKTAGGAQNDLWAYDRNSDTWQKVAASSGPGARHLHTAATANGKMVVFGGLDANGKELGDTWELDLNGTVWRKGQSLAQPLAAGDATNFTTSGVVSENGSMSNEKIFIFGGLSSGQPVDTVVIYTPGSWRSPSLAPVYQLLLD